MELEAFKLVAQGGATVAVLVTVWLFIRENRATGDKLDKIAGDFVTRVERIQQVFIDELRQINKESFDDRRLFQEQTQKQNDKMFDLTQNVVVAMGEMKNAVRALEQAVAQIRGKIEPIIETRKP